jgi:DNA polymerase III epsilon subunit-like protein
MMRRHHLTPPWHYRARCIESYVVGHLAGDPGGLQDCARALGLDPADYAAHSALGDAQMVRDCWLLIHMGIDAEFDRPVRDVLAQAKRQILREGDDDPAEVRAAFDRGPRDVTTMPDRTLRTR